MRSPTRLSTALSLGAIAVAVASCSQAAPEVVYEGPVPELSGARPWLMYATVGPQGGRFGGLEGALQSGVEASLLEPSSGRSTPLSPDAHGRFSVGHEVSVGGEVLLVIADAQVSFRVREADEARRAAVLPPAGGVGAVPNDLIPLGTGPDSRALVVRSGDNAVSPVAWQSGLQGQPDGIRLPSLQGPDSTRVPAGPWFGAALDEAGHRVAVSASLQAVVYIVDIQSGQVEQTLALSAPVTLPEPFVLPAPFDVDGDGQEELQVQTFEVGTPQPVAVVQDRLLVGFANVLRADLGEGQGQIMLPSVIASYDLKDLSQPPVLRVLPHLNPQEIRASELGGVLVTCSGTFRIAGVEAISPGAVYRLDPVSLQVLGERAFDSFLPTTALEAAGRVWVGSLGRPWIESFSWQDNAPGPRLTLNSEAVDSVFRLFLMPGGLIGVPSFNTDTLHVIDPGTASLNPEPFYAPLQVGPGGQLFDGLQIVARRPGRAGVDFVGPDLLVLSGIAARVTPIELRKILGP